jgi:Phage terminase large subunit (GpA)
MWEHIVWPEGRPEDAAFKCPHRAEQIPEIEKAGMVAARRWRITQPEVIGHAGFRLTR